MSTTRRIDCYCPDHIDANGHPLSALAPAALAEKGDAHRLVIDAHGRGVASQAMRAITGIRPITRGH